MSKKSTVMCEACGDVYETAWTDEMAEEEYKQKWGVDAPTGRERAIVCDRCYQRMLKLIPPEKFVK